MTTQKETTDSPMSAEITTVEFERSTLPSETYLSELGEDGPPYTIHGVALGAGDVTKGKSGIKKRWPAEELQEAADTLQGTSLVVNHDNTAQGVVGRVTKAGYKDGVGVVYEAQLYDEDLAEKIQNDLLEVSVRGLHADIDALSEDPETGAIEVEDIEFKNLSIVPSGAAPSNTLQMGEHTELSEAELSAFTEELEAEELEELAPGDWVKWGEKRGIIMSQIEDGETKVDVYEKVDGKWRAIGQTETVSVDDLSKWDVDEDEIGAAKEDEDDSSSDEEENADADADEELGTHKGAVEKGDWVTYEDFDGNNVYGRVIGIQQEEGRRIAKITLWQKSDDGWMKVEETAERPSAVLDSWDDHPEPNAEEEAGAVERGQFVKWKDVDNSWRHGQIIDIDQMGAQMVATLRRFTEAGDKLDETERKPVQGLDRWDWSPDTHKSKESNVSQSEPSESNSGVGVGEVVNFLSNFVEENASTTKDVPTQDAEPSHEPMGGDEPRIGEMTIQQFVERLRSVEELRGEGEEEELDSPQAVREMMENSPERFLPDEEEELSDDTSADEGENNTEAMTSEASDVEELQDYEMHEVSYDGTTEQDWDKPALEDFLSEMDADAEGWGDLSQEQKESIASHFIISSSGFPPENFGDLNLPVVEPSGELNVNALAAVKGGHGAPAVEGLGDSMEQDIIEYVNNLANRKFDENWGNDEEENSSDSSTTDGSTEATTSVTGLRVLPGDDLREGSTGESEMDSLTQYKVTTMEEDIQEKLSELNEPVAVEAEELSELQEKADRFEELSENIEALKERTEILDAVDREAVEELRESDDPVVVESTRYEELTSEAEQVKGVYAESLAQEMPGFEAEELTDNFSIEELREKHEEVVGSVEEELSASSEDAEPRSQDPSEEELEEASASEEEKEAEELADEAEAKREEIRNKIFQ